MLLVNHLVFSSDVEAKELQGNCAFWSYFRSYCLSYARGSIVFVETVSVNAQLKNSISNDKSSNRNSSLLGSISMLPMMNRAVSLDSFIQSSAQMDECPIWLTSEMSLLSKQGDICMQNFSEFSLLVNALVNSSTMRNVLLKWMTFQDVESLVSILYPELTAFMTVSRLSVDTKSQSVLAKWDNYLKVAAESYLASHQGTDTSLSVCYETEVSD